MEMVEVKKETVKEKAETEEDNPGGVGVSIVGHMEVVPTQVLNVRHRERGTS